MFSTGVNIKDCVEPLKKVTPEYIFNALRAPKPEFESKIRQIRTVRQLNASQYPSLKQQLPFFVCAVFNPPFRKTENFAYTEHFIIDIDHIGEKGMTMENLKLRIQADPRTFLCFVSPSEDGLKVVMRLKERCYDSGVYSVFYRRFVQNFSLEYGLQQVIDSKTCDVTRACFMSVDRDAYFNPDSEPVDMSSVVSMGDTSELLREKSMVERSESVHCIAESDCSVPEQSADNVEAASGPDDEAMSRIKELLNLKVKKPVEKPVYVPEILNALQSDLVSYMRELGLKVTEILNIQYGKKIRAELGLKKAEVNLFYGKRGFSVVVSPKTGTDEKLNELLSSAVQTFIDER